MRTCTLLALTFALTAPGAVAQVTPESRAPKKPTAGKAPGKNATGSGPFLAGCTMPFTPQAGLPIDGSCPIGGAADPKSPEGLQNLAKNNFCATGPAVTVTPAILGQLQTAAAAKGVTFGSEAEVPKDRSVLHQGFTIAGQNYHEGQRVRMVVFIIETHGADLTGGESVNCKNNGAPENDVHMALGMAYGDNECTSVTAELSPHFRTDQWKPLADVPAKAKAGAHPPALTTTPLRVEGQLFFDASHKICTASGEVSGSPARQSLWEIHPVYRVDVCTKTSLAACKVDDESVWKPVTAAAPSH